MCGLSLIFIPPIVYGGLTVLGVVSAGPGGGGLRAHIIFQQRRSRFTARDMRTLEFLRCLLCSCRLRSATLRSPVHLWSQSESRDSVASILVSGGFFAVAHRRSLRIALYTGAVLVAATTFTVGVGLIRSR